jgi:hypothetical protein
MLVRNVSCLSRTDELYITHVREIKKSSRIAPKILHQDYSCMILDPGHTRSTELRQLHAACPSHGIFGARFNHPEILHQVTSLLVHASIIQQHSQLTVHLVHRLFLGYMLEHPIPLDQPKSLDGVIEQCAWLRIFGSGLKA